MSSEAEWLRDAAAARHDARLMSGGKIPAYGAVGFDGEVPGERPQVGRARWVVLEDLGGVERPLEIGGFGLVLAGPDLDHGLQEANGD